MLAPCTVMLSEPDPPALLRRVTLIEPTSSEKDPLRLDTDAPPLSLTTRLPFNNCPIPQRNDVSDNQPVLSHAVTPTRTDPQKDTPPKFDPCTVTLVDPDDPAFTRARMLNTPASEESTLVKLPKATDEVTSIRKLPADPPPLRHRIDESDTHSLPWQIVRPTPAIELYPDSPDRAPRTVKLKEPVAALFARASTLTIRLSAV